MTDTEILHARAVALARPAPVPSRDATVDVLTFCLGRETCALDVSVLHGVVRLKELAVTPGSPSQIAGLTLWRGLLLPVVDVAGPLGLAREGLDDRAWLLVVGRHAPMMALLTGLPGGLTRLRAKDITKEGQGVPATPLVKGITKDAVVVLDPDALVELIG